MSDAPVGKLLGRRRLRARSMHAPCNTFATPLQGLFMAISKLFKNHSDPVLNDFRYAASGLERAGKNQNRSENQR